MPNDNTPTIQWTQTPFPREPIQPLLDHALWILRGWHPSEFDLRGNEAYWLVEQLSLMLIDRETDANALREALLVAIEQIGDAERRVDRQHQIIRDMRERLRAQPREAAA